MNKVSNFLTYCCLQCSPTLLTSVGTAAMSFILMSVVKLTGVCFEICHRVWLGECFLCPCKERTFCVVGGSVCQRHVVVDDVVVPFLSALTDFGQQLSEEGCGSPAGNGSSAARLRPVRCRVTWFESRLSAASSWRVVEGRYVSLMNLSLLLMFIVYSYETALIPAGCAPALGDSHPMLIKRLQIPVTMALGSSLCF